MSDLKVMIIDDEPLAIERLTDLLRRMTGVEILGVHQSAADALESLGRGRPDLILVDIEMPKIDGFDFVEALAKEDWLQPDSAPCICFVTAYPQFAAVAFETGALDFLCKPVRLGRLEKTIDRCRLTLARRGALARLEDLQSQLDALRASRSSPLAPSFWVHQRGQMVRVPVEALEWVEAEGEYVRLHLRDQSFLLRGSISSMADRLAEFGFARVHRSTIVNGSRLATVHSSRRGMKAILDSGVTIAVGRTYRPAVRALRCDPPPGSPSDVPSVARW